MRLSTRRRFAIIAFGALIGLTTISVLRSVFETHLDQHNQFGGAGVLARGGGHRRGAAPHIVSKEEAIAAANVARAATRIAQEEGRLQPVGVPRLPVGISWLDTADPFVADDEDRGDDDRGGGFLQPSDLPPRMAGAARFFNKDGAQYVGRENMQRTGAARPARSQQSAATSVQPRQPRSSPRPSPRPRPSLGLSSAPGNKPRPQRELVARHFPRRRGNSGASNKFASEATIVLQRQLSEKAKCTAGVSFGFAKNGHSMWADKGCRGVFKYTSPGGKFVRDAIVCESFTSRSRGSGNPRVPCFFVDVVGDRTAMSAAAVGAVAGGAALPAAPGTAAVPGAPRRIAPGGAVVKVSSWERLRAQRDMLKQRTDTLRAQLSRSDPAKALAVAAAHRVADAGPRIDPILLRGPKAAKDATVRSSTLQCNGLHIADVVFAVLARRSNDPRAKAALKSWLRHVPYAKVFLNNRGLLGADFIRALLKAKRAFPGKAWYVIIDEDASVMLKNFLCVLAKERGDANKVYMGAHHCQGPNFRCRTGGIRSMYNGWVNGGAGMVLSGALVSSMNLPTCLSHYTNKWRYRPPAADVALACCVADNWRGGRITHHEGFYRERKNYECECYPNPRNRRQRYCTGTKDKSKRVTHHHLGARDIVRYFEEHMRDQKAAFARSAVCPASGDKCGGVARTERLD